MSKNTTIDLLNQICEENNLSLVANNQEKEWALVLRNVPSYFKKERKANPFFPQTNYVQNAPARLMIILYGQRKHLTSVPKELYVHINDLNKDEDLIKFNFNDL